MAESAADSEKTATPRHHIVNLSDTTVIKAMSTPEAHYVCVDVFAKALEISHRRAGTRGTGARAIAATCQPFPSSRPVLEDAKTVFNLARSC
jgi:hypothetical protein